MQTYNARLMLTIFLLSWPVRHVFQTLPFCVRHLSFRWSGASDKVGNYTTELLDPENMEVDTGIMPASRPVPELQGGQLCTPSRRLLYKIRSAFRG